MRTRKLRSINIESFISDLRNTPLLLNPADNFDSLITQYDKVLRSILDDHAPDVERCVILRPHAPWYSDALRDAKQKRRRLERKWLKSGLTVHKDIYKRQCTIYRDLLSKAKSNYHCQEIAECEPRNLFRIIDKLSSVQSANILPNSSNPKDLADKFVKFFHDKIQKLQDRTNGQDSTLTPLC
ncbi:hypothetical protein HOLleu_31107 [Holothuria leucospilota]|uniref:Uncharacterized protein n=1 Tax=Holothuria leucospilota TaxID=206669 RepID=A0A9Q1BLD1_HOLLE|nr:hypothetical protein HOLleu_31107 [Holothuria leucospilota]